MNGMQGHALGDAEFHREKFSPAAHGEKVAEVFNLRRIENLERELAQAKVLLSNQTSYIKELQQINLDQNKKLALAASAFEYVRGLAACEETRDFPTIYNTAHEALEEVKK